LNFRSRVNWDHLPLHATAVNHIQDSIQLHALPSCTELLIGLYPVLLDRAKLHRSFVAPKLETMSGKGRGSGSTWSGGRGNGTASTKTGDAAGRGGRGGTQSSYQRQQSKGKRSCQQGSQSARLQGTGRKESLLKAQRREEGDALDKQFGYERYYYFFAAFELSCLQISEA
jgi:hypothetical protein